MRPKTPSILAGHPIIVCGHLVVGILERRAVWRGRTLDLAPEAFDLLAFLASHEGQRFSREELVTGVWGPDAAEAGRIDQIIVSLRLALGEGADMIASVGASGYRFSPVHAGSFIYR